jgi:hypothetical protein
MISFVISTPILIGAEIFLLENHSQDFSSNLSLVAEEIGIEMTVEVY